MHWRIGFAGVTPNTISSCDQIVFAGEEGGFDTVALAVSAWDWM